MEEIFRYQQLRQSQKLSGEQKRLIGLLLYPDDTYSPLANKLIDINGGGGSGDSITSRIEEHRRAEKPIEQATDLQSTIRAVYDWLNFKARPIKSTELTSFVSSPNTFESFDLTKEWVRYADNFLIACYQSNISINYCVDFQLLIRICYLFRIAIVVTDGKLGVRDNVSDALIDAILTQPILLPALVLRSRCTGDCKEKGKVEFPVVPTIPEGRGNKPCECKCDTTCQQPSSHCICINTYVADLFVIKEELARYEEGDIADIENILVC